MTKSMLSLVAGAALLGTVGVASATEPMLLAEAEMDGITAGAGVTFAATDTGTGDAVKTKSRQRAIAVALPNGRSFAVGVAVEKVVAYGADAQASVAIDANPVGAVTSERTKYISIQTPKKAIAIGISHAKASDPK